jgi:hypothetical protein
VSDDTPQPPDSPLPQPRSRLPFAQRMPGQNAAGGIEIAILASVATALVGLAIYMSLVLRHPWTSPYVIAPAIGAVWFALRLFLKFTPKG